MTILYVLLVAHFIGDFLVAPNQSKRWDALALHVWIYIGVLAGAVVAVGWQGGWQRGSVPDIGWWLVVNAVAHFVQEAITSRILARLWFIDGVRLRRDAIMDTPTHLEPVYDRARAIRREMSLYEVAYNNKRHWFFVMSGVDQLLHYVTLFVTADWWLR